MSLRATLLLSVLGNFTEVVFVSKLQAMTMGVSLLQPKRRPWLGENKSYSFTLAANIQGKTDSKSLNGELIYRPRWRSLRPLWRVLRILLILAAIAGAVYFILWLGGGLEQLLDNPGQWLS